MKALLWNSSLETGINKIDEQHKELITKISELMEMAKNPVTNGLKIKDIIAFLESYVKTHFSTEEAFMKVKKYQSMVSHVREHQYFTSEFLKLKDKLNKEGITLELKLKLNNLLVDWLIKHISNVDKKLSEIA